MKNRSTDEALLVLNFTLIPKEEVDGKGDGREEVKTAEEQKPTGGADDDLD